MGDEAKGKACNYASSSMLVKKENNNNRNNSNESISHIIIVKHSD
jgi:hypothetical protein